MAEYKITKERNILDGYTRYFLYVNNGFVKGDDSLEVIVDMAKKLEENNGNPNIVTILKEYSC